ARHRSTGSSLLLPAAPACPTPLPVLHGRVPPRRVSPRQGFAPSRGARGSHPDGPEGPPRRAPSPRATPADRRSREERPDGFPDPHHPRPQSLGRLARTALRALGAAAGPVAPLPHDLVRAGLPLGADERTAHGSALVDPQHGARALVPFGWPERAVRAARHGD